MERQTSNDSRVRIVVFEPPREPAQLANILMARLGMHRTDANQQARHAPGILPIQLSRFDAAPIVADLQAAGLPAAVVADDDLPPLDDVDVVHNARVLAEGLQIFDLHGSERELIPWHAVELVALGQVPLESTKRYGEGEMVVTVGRHAPHGPVNVVSSPGPEAWIVTQTPPRSWRLDHKRMNYESLPGKSGSATANFRLWFEQLVQRVDPRVLTPAAKAYVMGRHVAEWEFHSTAELKRDVELHWLLRHRAAEPPA